MIAEWASVCFLLSKLKSTSHDVFGMFHVCVNVPNGLVIKCYRNSPACTRLPETWTNTKTETKFPVDTGTTITVSCQEGYINTGSKIVTCNTYLYQDFQYDTEPNCQSVGKYDNLTKMTNFKIL